jgi:hypothetical protein
MLDKKALQRAFALSQNKKKTKVLTAAGRYGQHTEETTMENKRWTAADAYNRIGQARLGSLDGDQISADFIKGLKKAIAEWTEAIDEISITTCRNCGREATIEEAIDAGWIPSVIDRDGNEDLEPVCPECLEKHYDQNNEGEWIEKTA